jgi:hypothetical protein
MSQGFVPWFLEVVIRDLRHVGLRPWTDGAWGHGGMVFAVGGVGTVTWPIAEAAR